MAETDILFESQIQNCATDGAALGDECQVACCRHFSGKTGVQMNTWADDSHAVRPHDAQPSRMCDTNDVLLDQSALHSDFLAAC